jgi:hypothetical protein
METSYSNIDEVSPSKTEMFMNVSELAKSVLGSVGLYFFILI